MGEMTVLTGLDPPLFTVATSGEGGVEDGGRR